MSENIPESIPTSADPKSRRPVKKQRGPVTASDKQASEVEALFANPEREIRLPSGPIAKTLAPPPEIVTNVQGSSAGAGSGEFHVYKASRRREYERLRLMDEETRKEEADRDYDAKREELRKLDEAKLSKNRARRQKQKARGQKKTANNDADGNAADDTRPQVASVDGGAVQKLHKPPPRIRDEQDDTLASGIAKNDEEIGITFHDED